ncbi:cytochrome P450 [Mycobacterium sp.]|uniref:cytochrome P450 n=1 Tax=Mycobacterium sp. TaxID=1785 RepID=UPI003BB57A20
MPESCPASAAPYAAGTGLPWDVPVSDAVAAIAAARAEYGDTFAVHSGQGNYLFTFSPKGVESFYGLAEEKASKGVADFLMLRRKLPDAIFDGRRILPGTLFRRDDVAGYLSNLEWALRQATAELGSAGSVDVFDLTRRLAHRMGLASWAGPGSAHGEAFEQLVRAFDVLDGSDAFVHPDAMAAVAASGKRAEQAALDEIAEIVAAAVRSHDADSAQGQALFSRIVDAWSGEAADARVRGIAFDVALIHIASMSNLAAALGWALVDLVEHPAHLARVVAADADLAQRCALESTRLAQRSIMSRAVLSPVVLDTGDMSYQVPPGWTIATLLPLLNTSAAPGLEDWNPERWTRHRLNDEKSLPSPMLVTAFGHGRHSCPAQPFSLSAMTAAMTHLFGCYRMTPKWTTHPRPVPAQIGGVARADGPCRLHYVGG